MILYFAAFTDRGETLANTLAGSLGGQVIRCGSGKTSLQDFTREAFSQAEGIIFVGAVGIAVRAIAPHIRHKTLDPAVVVVDEGGQYAIPILSGHLGGANELSGRIAALIDAIPVITTATDIRGVFSVDAWARKQGCRVVRPQLIRKISGALLQGGSMTMMSEFPISGPCPEGVLMTEDSPMPDAALTIHRQGEDTLCLVPPVVCLGIGCKAGISSAAIERLYGQVLEELQLLPEAVYAVATIDRKAREPGLLSFCEAHGLSLVTFTAEELNAIPGQFTESAFVHATVGTGNVCERSAICLTGGNLILEKTALEGVTMAAAVKPFWPDWSWNNE